MSSKPIKKPIKKPIVQYKDCKTVVIGYVDENGKKHFYKDEKASKQVTKGPEGK